ncbi:hypothetical protein L1D52_19690 [Vibrio brasiliensis]|uniref:hypothetical protein n=1 Tax=Vibrio brasiliensis TaxID=170652 RepID=UPI001EFEE5D9|nr:hypothetical protein [Vibrio brasiliensis]MCG9784574.1 hypothetical protein [Vibrio brasiliensis]
MYIRFIASMEEEKKLQHTHGIITQAKLMLDDGLILYSYHREQLNAIFEQLNDTLPCPPFEHSNWPNNAISWFLDSSTSFVALMYELKHILEEYNTIVTVLQYQDVGSILYRDAYQVVAKSSQL